VWRATGVREQALERSISDQRSAGVPRSQVLLAADKRRNLAETAARNQIATPERAAKKLLAERPLS
jgi:hypothetical protein